MHAMFKTSQSTHSYYGVVSATYILYDVVFFLTRFFLGFYIFTVGGHKKMGGPRTHSPSCGCARHAHECNHNRMECCLLYDTMIDRQTAVGEVGEFYTRVTTLYDS